MELSDIVGRIDKLMINEDRKDVEFRHIIATTEVGDIGKYITHDPILNPGARPHGSDQDKVLAYGQAFIQLMALAGLHNVSVEEAVNYGLRNWEDADWRKIEAKNKERIVGKVANPGSVGGTAYVVSSEHPMDKISMGQIMVTEYALPDISNYLDKLLAFVTDHGGATCHAANVAREKGVICIVGTGNATKLIKHGQEIYVDASDMNKQGEVILK
ncbi:MAG: PEP-utilizing enzyme [archaeon]